MNHGDVLRMIALTLPYREVYLELGVQFGETHSKVAPLFTRSIGVDTDERSGQCVKEFYCMTTYEFFKDVDIGTKADLVFIDADHRHIRSWQDFCCASRIIRPLTSLIVLHDTYPENENELQDVFCSDSWKTAVAIREIPNWESVTLPGMHGLTICRYVPDGRHLHWMA